MGGAQRRGRGHRLPHGRFDENNLYLGFGFYKKGLEEPRHPIPATLDVRPLNGGTAFTLPTNDAALDIATEGNHAFVLTYSGIEEWDLAQKARLADTPPIVSAKWLIRNTL